MSPLDDDHTRMLEWCPLIHEDDYTKIGASELELHRMSNAYDDWRAAMRGKSSSDTTGVLLDRIRMLMIGVGISCGQNRELAERVQAVVSQRLRSLAVKYAQGLPGTTGTEIRIRGALIRFFSTLRFTRDLDPREEIQQALRETPPSAHDARVAEILSRVLRTQSEMEKRVRQEGDNVLGLISPALRSAAVILQKIYERLMSPDPWGNDSDR
ncbi:MAG: hypothetical protein HXY34_08105 [Candidatus Thorarchaeota archaeon]|nr:hypothetical protein [Candidatus Thorarchaeota archaeon]